MDGMVAIITGGAGDLGRGISRALEKAGATVAVLDVDTARAESADTVIRCDVSDRAAASAAVDEVVGAHGRIDVLVNMAQAWGKFALIDVTDEEMTRVWETGPAATLRMMQLCYPHLKAAGGGAIINAGSSAGTQGGVPGEGVYAGAKEAIRGITKHAAAEWGPDGIRVNVLCPVATDDPGRFPEGVADRIPLRRMGDPEVDVGGTVVFLASPAGSFITGRTFMLDGGIGMFR
jgi:NAD(P)-dependent dehydrogenase (short-subunit alcohol dehydrogenase family)